MKLFKPNFKELVKGLDLDIKKKEIEKLKEAVQKFQEKQQIENLLAEKIMLNFHPIELLYMMFQLPLALLHL